MREIGARLVVVKIGSALLIEQEGLLIRSSWLSSLGEDVAALRSKGSLVVIVTSGAVAIGCRRLGIEARKLRLADKQAAAAVGQIHLAGAYERTFADLGMTAAQVLLSADDIRRADQSHNARQTLSQLLSRGAIPIINENDTVATEEIRFGDNDVLSARVAAMMEADLLVLLSDVDGLYTSDPKIDQSAHHLPVVHEVTPEIRKMADGARSHLGSGGMASKLAAAEAAASTGARVAICSGRSLHPLRSLMAGGRATWFGNKQASDAPRHCGAISTAA